MASKKPRKAGCAICLLLVSLLLGGLLVAAQEYCRLLCNDTAETTSVSDLS